MRMSLATLVLVVGLTQPALADSGGTWGCPAMLSATSTHVQAAAIRVWNWSDTGDVVIEDINIFENNGTPRSVAFSPVQLGPHQETVFVVQNLLGVALTPGFRLFGIQVIVKWRAKGHGQPLAEISWNVNNRDPVSGAMTVLVSFCRESPKCFSPSGFPGGLCVRKPHPSGPIFARMGRRPPHFGAAHPRFVDPEAG